MKLLYLLLITEDMWFERVPHLLANEITVFATVQRSYIINDQFPLLLANEIAVFATDYRRYTSNDQVALL